MTLDTIVSLVIPLVSLMTLSPVMTWTLMSICTHAVSHEQLDGFSWNFVWTLCYWRLLQSSNFRLQTLGNTNMMDAQSCEVGWRWCHYPWSSLHVQRCHHIVTTGTWDTIVTSDLGYRCCIYFFPLASLMTSSPLMFVLMQ
jgi:hypothetical protein